ncbi:MAG TPA: hypothetical protein VK929_15405 [Longimicrobiales bacterium]|nr:hypothetical protein [Longimicrobiales bacterium]
MKSIPRDNFDGDDARGAPEPPAPGFDTPPEPEHRCDLCGAPMEEWHCRIICTFCGYQRDCSDP